MYYWLDWPVESFFNHSLMESPSLKSSSPCEKVTSDYTICPMLLENVEEALTLLATIYAKDEPLTAFLRLKPSDVYEFFHKSFVDGIEDGMSFVAKDKDENIIATGRAIDFKREHGSGNGITTLENGAHHLLQIGNELRSRDTVLLSKLQTQKGAHFGSLSIHKDWRRTDVGLQLGHAIEEIFLLKGYTIAFSEASNPRSSYFLSEGFKFHPTATLHYNEYRYDDVCPFAAIGEGKCELLVKYDFEETQ
jgi:hypothetical protein